MVIVDCFNSVTASDGYNLLPHRFAKLLLLFFRSSMLTVWTPISSACPVIQQSLLSPTKSPCEKIYLSHQFWWKKFDLTLCITFSNPIIAIHLKKKHKTLQVMLYQLLAIVMIVKENNIIIGIHLKKIHRNVNEIVQLYKLLVMLWLWSRILHYKWSSNSSSREHVDSS